IAHPPAIAKDSVAVHSWSHRPAGEIVLRVGVHRNSRINSNHLLNWLIPAQGTEDGRTTCLESGVESFILQEFLKGIRESDFVVLHDESGDAGEERRDPPLIGNNHGRTRGY